jgi:hypothetical protein
MTIQVVTLVVDRGFWKEQAASILLAIDVRHAASLISESVLREYSDLAPRQISDYGFASVWVVGPTTEQTSRLGGGWP